MSGTSLDGLDIAACRFQQEEGAWRYELIATQTLPYPKAWQERLRKAPELSGEALTELDRQYGHYIGREVAAFLSKNAFQPDFIASHGHTIFHRPEQNFSLQIGSGAAIARETSHTVINDFRALDIAYEGQGAPLVPAGDRLLFGEYDACLNLGGIANMSYEEQGKRVAFDICPVNMALDPLAREKGLKFDKNGELARQGKIDHSLLEALNKIAFYQTPPPRSLGREWYKTSFLPLVEKTTCTPENKLRTLTEHLARQITAFFPSSPDDRVLVTGGGGHNRFLIERLQALSTCQVELPDRELTDFKEALVFAFLGLLRRGNLPNCYASATGALLDTSGGAIHQPPSTSTGG